MPKITIAGASNASETRPDAAEPLVMMTQREPATPAAPAAETPAVVEAVTPAKPRGTRTRKVATTEEQPDVTETPTADEEPAQTVNEA